jgi:hypothetical protein
MKQVENSDISEKEKAMVLKLLNLGGARTALNAIE